MIFPGIRRLSRRTLALGAEASARSATLSDVTLAVKVDPLALNAFGSGVAILPWRQVR